MSSPHLATDPVIDSGERRSPAWTFAAPPVDARYAPHSARDWLAWLIALAVLLFFAAFGLNALAWARAGGWNLLWLLAGLPLFPTFSVLAAKFVFQTWRQRRPLRLALENLAFERSENFRAGEPLQVRLKGSVPAAGAGERTAAPARIAVRLVLRQPGVDGDGPPTQPSESCDETFAPSSKGTGEDKGLHVYACALHPLPAHAEAARPLDAQWFIELHDGGHGASGPPFWVARLPPLRDARPSEAATATATATAADCG